MRRVAAFLCGLIVFVFVFVVHVAIADFVLHLGADWWRMVFGAVAVGIAAKAAESVENLIDPASAKEEE